MNGQQIKYFSEFLLLQEGENFTTYCNSSSTFYNLQWYKQSPGGSPALLMILAKGGEVNTEQRLTGRLGESKQHSSLHLMAAQLSDAGTYFCAGHSALEAPAVCSQTSLGLQGSLLLISPQSRGQRKLKSWCLWRNLSFNLKKSPDSVSLKNSVKHWLIHNFLQKIERK